MSQTQAHDPRELLLFPPLKAVRGPNGGLVLTQKYVEGIQEYAATWPGPITTIVSYRKTMTTDMDHVEIMPTDPQIALEVRPEDPAALASRVENAAMVMAFLSPFEETLGRICAEKGIPIAYTAEYAPKTERQIMHTHTTSVLRRLRRSAWIWNATRIRREMAKKAAGLQLSGTPVYDSYRPFCAESLLFFDNRVRADEILKEADLERKIADFQQDRPLRLVFGGRLIGMKGVMELPRIAQALRDRGVAFALDIFGSGPLEEELGRQIEALGLQGHVTMQVCARFSHGLGPGAAAGLRPVCVPAFAGRPVQHLSRGDGLRCADCRICQ